jgi:hypothetical protein
MPSFISVRGSQFVIWSTSECIVCCYRPIPFTRLHQRAELRDDSICLNVATDADSYFPFPSKSELLLGSLHEVHDIDRGFECLFQLSRVSNAVPVALHMLYQPFVDELTYGGDIIDAMGV